MKHFAAAALTSLLAAEGVTAHYIFQQLSVGGTKYPVFDYIRKNSNYNSPVTDLASNDLRCNVGASGAATSTVDVKAGSSFTFTLDTPVYHQGPVSLYMSKAPSSAKDYDGSGNWFKIKDWGPSFSGNQASWPMEGSYTFNVPSCIADGEYLLRIQSMGIHNPWPAGIPQFYISCAQIKVTGGGSTSPANTVKIPGFIKESDPGYTANIYANFNSYTVPGPSVFTCSGGGGGGNNDTPAPPTTTLVTRTSTAPAPTTTSGGGGGGCSAAKFAQCGGNGFTGCTTCAAGSTCSKTNDWCMLAISHSPYRNQILTDTC